MGSLLIGSMILNKPPSIWSSVRTMKERDDSFTGFPCETLKVQWLQKGVGAREKHKIVQIIQQCPLSMSFVYVCAHAHTYWGQKWTSRVPFYCSTVDHQVRVSLNPEISWQLAPMQSCHPPTKHKDGRYAWLGFFTHGLGFWLRSLCSYSKCSYLLNPPQSPFQIFFS